MGLAYGNPEVRKQIGIKKKDARKLASTKHAGLPEKVSEECLHELFEFFDAQALMGAVQPKPQFQLDAPSGIGTPGELNPDIHPIDAQRRQIDMAIQSGADPTMAHQQVMGDVNLGDTDSKADFASTLGRVQQNSAKKGININPASQSLLAQDSRLEQEKYGQPGPDTDDALRTPVRQQTPSEPLTTMEEVDYNDDVAYLQKYGRA